MKRIAVFGRSHQTANYENFFRRLPASVFSTLDLNKLEDCDTLVLPGGGDITPSFFGEDPDGSRNIDTALDILQFQAVEYALKKALPILGICKGMQVINVAFGGTILQNMEGDQIHPYIGKDSYHNTEILEGSCLYKLYGNHMIVNSAHHQRINHLGKDLKIIQWCTDDNCPEALIHEHLPVLGVQWHPERLPTECKLLADAPFLTLLKNSYSTVPL